MSLLDALVGGVQAPWLSSALGIDEAEAHQLLATFHGNTTELLKYLVANGFNIGGGPGQVKTSAGVQAAMKTAEDWLGKQVQEQEYGAVSTLFDNPVVGGLAGLLNSINPGGAKPLLTVTEPGTHAAAQPKPGSAGSTIANALNQPLTGAQQQVLEAGGAAGSPVAVIQQVATELGTRAGMDSNTLIAFQNLAVATAMEESGLNPQNIGDNGSSFGLFQLHRGGELGNLTPQQAFDPYTNARVALQQFVDVWKGANSYQRSRWMDNPGEWAFTAQRPSEDVRVKYISDINASTEQIASGDVPIQATRAPILTSDFQPIYVGSPEYDAYNRISQAWQAAYGTQPPIAAVQAASGFSTVEQAQNWVNSMPSGVGDMTVGQLAQYQSMVGNAANKYLGVAVPDSFLSQLYNQGIKDPSAVQLYFEHHPATSIPTGAVSAISKAVTDHPLNPEGQPPTPDQINAIYEQSQQAPSHAPKGPQ